LSTYPTVEFPVGVSTLSDSLFTFGSSFFVLVLDSADLTVDDFLYEPFSKSPLLSFSDCERGLGLAPSKLLVADL